MKVSICLPTDLGESEVNRWHHLQEQRLEYKNPFLSPEFAIAVSRVRDNARVAVVETGDRIVGYLAFEVAALGRARPIGSGLVTDAQAFVHDVDFDWTWDELLKGCRLQVCDFDHLLRDHAPAGDPGWRIAASPIIDLSGGYDAYLRAASTKSRHLLKNLRYQERRLGRDFQLVDFRCGPPTQEMLHRMVVLKSRQYQRNGLRNIYQGGDFWQVIESVSAASDAALRPTFSALLLDGKLVAGEFTLCSDAVAAGWIATYDMEYARYSPGFVRMLYTLKAYADKGIEYLDLGRGDEEYKRQLCNGELAVAEGTVSRKSFPAKLWRANSTARRSVADFVFRHRRLRLAVRGVRRRLNPLPRQPHPDAQG